MTSPSSLRDLYGEQGSAWSFVPTAVTPPAPAPAAQLASSSANYTWSNKPTHNSIFDLSPSLDLSEPSAVDVSLLFKSLLASAALQYTSTAIAMPWEVGKLLLQVQWVPRDTGEPEPVSHIAQVDEEALSDSDNDNDSYFADPNNAGSSHFPPQRLSENAQSQATLHSLLEGDTRPEYVIPVGSADGVWGMIKRVGRFRGEGWLALFKGLLTACVMEFLSSTIEPFIQATLQSLFIPSFTPFHQPPIVLPVSSHLLTGLILSPLDLVRTRLIVQSFMPRYSTYNGPLDALSQIIRQEGGLRGIYLHPQLLIPTVIDSALRPLISLALPGILASYIGPQITPDANPIAWYSMELAGSCLGLLITLPFETVRRRLQVQVRGTAKPIRACVELRPAPYNGVVDTFWHILTEERSDLPVARRRAKTRRLSTTVANGDEPETSQVVEEEAEEGWSRRSGIGQLYRGLGMRLGASAIVFVLALLKGREEGDVGWAEL